MDLVGGKKSPLTHPRTSGTLSPGERAVNVSSGDDLPRGEGCRILALGTIATGERAVNDSSGDDLPRGQGYRILASGTIAPEERAADLTATPGVQLKMGDTLSLPRRGLSTQPTLA
jgi:hypothetical protein